MGTTKYKFTETYEENEIRYVIETDSIYDILETFHQFLVSCTFTEEQVYRAMSDFVKMNHTP